MPEFIELLREIRDTYGARMDALEATNTAQQAQIDDLLARVTTLETV